MDVLNFKEGLPTLITANQSLTLSELHNALVAHKLQITELLLKRGALMLRGFPIHTADDFINIIEILNFGKFVNYIGGDSPRDRVKNKVYTSTDAPPEFHIPLHQELSYIKAFPKHIYFFCETPPTSGGETIIADARKVTLSLDMKIIEQFQAKGLTYISHYFFKDKLLEFINRYKRSHKTWMEVFETDDKKQVEDICKKNEIEWQWLPKDWLQMRQNRPALLQHPQTKETVWFNQAHIYDFNPKLLGLFNYLGTRLVYARPNTRLHDIRFGNGERLPRKHLYHILDVLNHQTVAFPWQQGDVMILDNILAMHGRAPFTGKRRILTALTT